MHRWTKAGLIGIAIMICVAVIIVLLNLERIRHSASEECVKLDGGRTCHSSDKSPHRYYGTKTAYRAVLNESSLSNSQLKGCVPKALYLFSRHATRYPDSDQIADMGTLLYVLQEKIVNSSLHGKVNMCEEDIKKLKIWRNTMKQEDGKKITYNGALEAFMFARRLQDRFPDLLKQDYSPDKFLFEYTVKGRTMSTASAFAKGLFGNNATISFNSSFNDELLFHKHCKELQEQYCNDTGIDITEVTKFGKMIKKVASSIHRRIGVSATKDDLELAFLSCAFGYAHEISDAWCAIFSEDELKVLEYKDDIDDYYKDAYGNRINAEQACPIGRYVMDFFKAYESTGNSKATFHFSHAGALKKILALFGLFRDELPLTAGNFCSQGDRKWRSGIVCPFNANVLVVLYECGGVRKVAAFHNERLVQLGGCSQALCPIGEFYDAYGEMAAGCDVEKICQTCSV